MTVARHFSVGAGEPNGTWWVWGARRGPNVDPSGNTFLIFLFSVDDMVSRLGIYVCSRRKAPCLAPPDS
jgi:hypothetical protein